MTRITLICLLFFCNNSFGQIDSNLSDSLNKITYSEGYQNLLYDSLNTMFDSVQVKFKFNQKVIKAECYFTTTNKKLLINYYLNDNVLFYVKTSQICPTKPELTCNSRYYIVTDSINQEEYSSDKKISHGIVQTLEEISKAHTCPDKFDNAFLRDYIFKLFFKIRKLT